MKSDKPPQAAYSSEDEPPLVAEIEKQT